MAGLFEGFVEENPIFTDRAEKHAKRAEEAADRAVESATLASTEAQKVSESIAAAQMAAVRAEEAADRAGEGLDKIDDVHADVTTIYISVVQKASEVEGNAQNLEEAVAHAKNSADNAKNSEESALTAKDQTCVFKNQAQEASSKANISEVNAKGSENLARQYANQLGVNISITQDMINDANQLLSDTNQTAQRVFTTGDQVAADKVLIATDKEIVVSNASQVNSDRKEVTTLKTQTETLHSQSRIFRNEAEVFKNQANNAAKEARTSEQNITILGQEIASKQEVVDGQLVEVGNAVEEVNSKFGKINEAVASTSADKTSVNQVKGEIEAKALEVESNVTLVRGYKEEAKGSRDEAEAQAVLAKQYADQAAGSVKGVTSVNGENGDVVITSEKIGAATVEDLRSTQNIVDVLTTRPYVSKVNGQTGEVSVTAATLGAATTTEHNDLKTRVENLEAVPGGVTSVNGMTGNVVLNAFEVGAVGLTGNQSMSGRLSVNNHIIATGFVQADKYLVSSSQSTESNSVAQKGYVDTQVKGATDRITVLENKPQGGVTSVNGKDGDVELSAEDVGAVPVWDGVNAMRLGPVYIMGDSTVNGELTISVQSPSSNAATQKGYVDAQVKGVSDRVVALENMAGETGVTSVNGQTGSVTLDASDVGAASVTSHNALYDRVNNLTATSLGAVKDSGITVINNNSSTPGIGIRTKSNTGSGWVATYFQNEIDDSSLVCGNFNGYPMFGGHNKAMNAWRDVYINAQYGGVGPGVKTIMGEPYAVMSGSSTQHKIYHAGYKPTPSDIGAATTSHTHTDYAPLNGATLTGNTTVEQVHLSGHTSSNKQVLKGSGGSLLIGNDTLSDIYLDSSTANVYVRNGSSRYNVYHTGNKPSAVEIGAATSDHTHTGYISSSNPTLTGTTTVTSLNMSGLNTSNKLALSTSGSNLYVGNNSCSNLYLETSSGYAYIRAGSSSYRIYHEGYKPSSGVTDPGPSHSSWPVGTTVLATYTGSSAYAPGNTLPGGYLMPTNVVGIYSSSYTLPGSWRCMGYTTGSSNESRATLWFRIS